MYQSYQFKQKYKDINDVLYWIVEQAKVGIPYCKDKFPHWEDPRQMFYYLKNLVTFKNDPPGTELLQGPYTLFEDNYHGYLSSGAGDCDCFSILLLSCIWAQNWKGAKIILAGNKKSAPSHIYIEIPWKGENIILDLTESKPDQEREYKYYQALKTF